MLHTVRTGEHQPVVFADALQRLAQNLVRLRRQNLDRRNLQRLRSQILQPPRQLARLLARAGNHHTPAEQRLRLKPVQPVAQSNHLANHNHRRRPELCLLRALGNVSQRSRQRLLVSRGAPANHRHWRLRRGVPPQRIGDLADIADTHQDHFRRVELAKQFPVNRRLRLRRILVARQDRHR